MRSSLGSGAHPRRVSQAGYLRVQTHDPEIHEACSPTFLHNHAADRWTCDFLQVTDLLFRSLFAFFIIELKSRKVIHVCVTRFLTDGWTAVLATWHIRSEKATARWIERAFTGCRWVCKDDTI